MVGSTCSVQVAVRVRPLLSHETTTENIVSYQGDNRIVVGTKGEEKDRSFTFDHVFPETSTQTDLFEQCVQPVVDSFLSGYNASILAYGQTGSGKTFTMGTAGNDTMDPDNFGIVPRVVQYIFETLESQADTHSYSVTAQFIEIHNQEINDLLKPGCKQDCKKIFIQGGQRSEIKVVGVSEESANSYTELMACLNRGSSGRTTSSTAMNSTSSRSHAVFSVFLTQKKLHGDDSSSGLFGMEDETLTSKFNFVDLAGSERLKRTGAEGKQKQEGININQGLLALGNVISALGDPTKKGQHVPFRDSKITRLLQDSLGGNSKTLMIACASPAEPNEHETLNTLKYANRARNIKNTVTVNRDPNMAKMDLLRNRIVELEALLDQGSPADQNLHKQHEEQQKLQDGAALLMIEQIGVYEEEVSRLHSAMAVGRETVSQLREQLLQEREQHNTLQCTLAEAVSQHEQNHNCGVLSALLPSLTADQTSTAVAAAETPTTQASAVSPSQEDAEFDMDSLEEVTTLHQIASLKQQLHFQQMRLMSTQDEHLFQQQEQQLTYIREEEAATADCQRMCTSLEAKRVELEAEIRRTHEAKEAAIQKERELDEDASSTKSQATVYAKRCKALKAQVADTKAELVSCLQDLEAHKCREKKVSQWQQNAEDIKEKRKQLAQRKQQQEMEHQKWLDRKDTQLARASQLAEAARTQDQQFQEQCQKQASAAGLQLKQVLEGGAAKGCGDKRKSRGDSDTGNTSPSKRIRKEAWGEEQEAQQQQQQQQQTEIELELIAENQRLKEQITALQACRVMAESEEEESTAELQQKQQQSDMAKQVERYKSRCDKLSKRLTALQKQQQDSQSSLQRVENLATLKEMELKKKEEEIEALKKQLPSAEKVQAEVDKKERERIIMSLIAANRKMGTTLGAEQLKNIVKQNRASSAAEDSKDDKASRKYRTRHSQQKPSTSSSTSSLSSLGSMEENVDPLNTPGVQTRSQLRFQKQQQLQMSQSKQTPVPLAERNSNTNGTASVDNWIEMQDMTPKKPNVSSQRTRADKISALLQSPVQVYK